VALVFAEEELTYGELNRRANRLARHLQTLGVGREVLVAICAERSPEMVVGMLAVLKAGGAYVPLEPATPKERVRLVLEETSAPLVLTQRPWADHLSETGVQVVCLDVSEDVVARDGDDDLATVVSTDNLAYVIYTSGSTGRPKGVMVTHRSIGNTLRWRQAAFPLGPQDRVLHTIAFVFDPAVCAVFGPLLAGARLILPPPGAQREPATMSGPWPSNGSPTCSRPPPSSASI
jgi:non-ribosomal peptide synthetase component F